MSQGLTPEAELLVHKLVQKQLTKFCTILGALVAAVGAATVTWLAITVKATATETAETEMKELENGITTRLKGLEEDIALMKEEVDTFRRDWEKDIAAIDHLQSQTQTILENAKSKAQDALKNAEQAVDDTIQQHMDELVGDAQRGAKDIEALVTRLRRLLTEDADSIAEQIKRDKEFMRQIQDAIAPANDALEKAGNLESEIHRLRDSLEELSAEMPRSDALTAFEQEIYDDLYHMVSFLHVPIEQFESVPRPGVQDKAMFIAEHRVEFGPIAEYPEKSGLGSLEKGYCAGMFNPCKPRPDRVEVVLIMPYALKAKAFDILKHGRDRAWSRQQGPPRQP